MRTRGHGFQSGGHWAVCDICGKSVRNDRLYKNSDGLLVCSEDWEGSHPQESVRARHKSEGAKGIVTGQDIDIFVQSNRPAAGCTTLTSVSGEAIAGCATAGV